MTCNNNSVALIRRSYAKLVSNFAGRGCRMVSATDFRETGRHGMGWIDLVQYKDQWRALVKRVMNVGVPRNARQFLSRLASGSFSRWT
jgi:hypothetical protein